MAKKTSKPGKNRVVLSVDFDFFFQEKMEYDWGHRESNMFLHTVWPMRAAQFFSQGIDPIKELSVIGKPEELIGDLTDAGCKFSKNIQASVAESHASAYHALKELTNLEIINIDAHHDLFYGDLEKLNCGNWIGMLAMEGRVKKVTIVYPHWRKENNFDMPNEGTINKMKRLGVDVDIVYGIESTPPRKIDEIFFARSGCWVPPWLDEKFIQFVSMWMFISNGFRIWTYNSLEEFKREFDIESARQQSEILKLQYEEMKKMSALKS